MPIAAQFHAAAAAARNFPALEEISRTLWQAHAAGALSDNAAQAAAEAVEARRRLLRGPEARVTGKTRQRPPQARLAGSRQVYRPPPRSRRQRRCAEQDRRVVHTGRSRRAGRHCRRSETRWSVRIVSGCYRRAGRCVPDNLPKRIAASPRPRSRHRHRAPAPRPEKPNQRGRSRLARLALLAQAWHG
jgi:hypothetical protein